MPKGGRSVLHHRKVKVLVVDDSPVFGKLIAMALSGGGDAEVVGTARLAAEAVQLLHAARPDIVICGVEMPDANGIAFCRLLHRQYKLPFVIASSHPGAQGDALRAGASAFVQKPRDASKERLADFMRRIRECVLQAAIASGGKARRRLVAIGASTGGTEALMYIVSKLPPTFPALVMVQHMPPVFSRMFAERLNGASRLRVREAEGGETLQPGEAWLAPGDRHIAVVKSGGGYRLSCSDGDKVSGHRPSVDVLFRSVAETVGAAAVGVLLTGMGADGAAGLLRLRMSGAATIGQNEASSVIYGMPKAAYELGAVERQLGLADIPEALVALAETTA